MKKYLYGLLIGMGLMIGYSIVYAVSASPTSFGGTGTTSPSGILYGDNNATQHLNTVGIGSNLTFIGGVLSATGGASSTLLQDNNTFTGINKFTNASSDFSGTWQTFSPSHFQTAGNYITALTGDVTASGPGSVAATLKNTGPGAGSFTNSNITIDAQGRITAASNGSSGGGGGSSNVGTSTSETSGRIPFWTTTGATPALLSGGNAGLTFDGTKFTATNASTTVLTVSGIASTSVLRIDNLANGCLTSTSGLVGSQSCTTGSVTAVTGTWPIISSGGTTPNLTWGGLSTSTALLAGGLPYNTGPNTFGNVATTSVTCSNGTSCTSFTAIGPSPITISSSAFPFTTTTNFNQTANSTTTQLWLRGNPIALSASNTSIFASASTSLLSIFNLTSGRVPYSTTGGMLIDNSGLTFNGTTLAATYASTTAISVSGSEYLTPLGTPAGTFLAADPTGKIIATTSPSGTGTVTSVTLAAPNSSLSLSGTNPVTTSGTINADINVGHTNWFTALENFTNASTSMLTATSSAWLATAGGTVNIGTTTGTSALTVVGNTSAGRGVIYAENGTAQQRETVVMTRKTGSTGGGISFVMDDATVTGGKKWEFFTTDNQNGEGAGKWIAFDVSDNIDSIVANGSNIGFSTTTPGFILTPFSSTIPQLSLAAGTNIAQWTFRNAGGNLYTSTTTANGTATTTLSALTITGSNGNTGIASSTPGSLFSIGTTNGINFGTASSTFTTTGGINLQGGGCFAINGTCVGGGSGGSGTVTSVGLSSTNSTLSIGSTPVTTSGTITADINLAHSNIFTALQQFNGNASSTLESILGPLYVGRTATSTIFGDSATSTLISSLGVQKTSGTAFQVNDQYGTNIMNVGTASTTPGYYLLSLSSATSTGPLFGVDQYGHVVASSTTPTLTNCGTTPSLSSDSSDFAGTITVGSVSATACTLNFGTQHVVGAHCVISEQTGSITNASSYTESLSGFTYSQTALTSNKLDYICMGR